MAVPAASDGLADFRKCEGSCGLTAARVGFFVATHAPVENSVENLPKSADFQRFSDRNPHPAVIARNIG